ncbi:DUF814 domain-containing protein [Candidatus Woesearchaeota archaeon]|jgi:predicted ribosome quality control (RQC) complex YloA/Tae2 family protein|nr:DUF814 domain-containing protein [Candidatus Woesearchaeota archaeon]MBT4150977.1 DUF814 domain-containing protein [Candidatus Woesearchaeota archaeon]MBT4433767.1 DUF814 domain-containing protein [Candidatus Woesearchaeota archaeon]MBT7331900.1 DUF814 domain-containing protein [Candidatus Woesearchaeota archaeon]
MEIEISLNKNVDENAGIYFNLAKKAKKKLEGANKALGDSKKELASLEKNEEKFQLEQEKKQEKKQRKKEWYEKFHWFMSSEDFLCVGGKDATSNEIIVKKHMEKDDIVFHTDMAGSPFFVIKNGKDASEITLKETAQAVAVYSRAWKLGHASADVFYVKPEQVTKEAQSGESLSKGSFMVYGKTEYLHPKLEYAIGLVEDEIIGGPVTAIEKKTKKYVIVISGRNKKSALAKKIKAKLKGGDLDDIIKFLPAGGAEMKK